MQYKFEFLTISLQKIFAPGGGGGGADGHVHGALDRVHVGGEEVVLLFLIALFSSFFSFSFAGST